MDDTAQSAKTKDRGRGAEWPSEIGFRGWLDILRRVFSEIQQDRVMLVAAGATFYMLLALFPALTAFVSLYGFVADPKTIADHVALLGSFMPSGGVDMIQSQLQSLISADRDALSVSFVVGLLVAMWSANNGIKTMFEALNIAYEEREKRGFFRLNALSFAFTLGAIGIAILMIVCVGVIPAVLAFLHLQEWADLLIRILRWPLTLVFIALAIGVVYRYGPSRRTAKWRWISWGAGLSTLVWFLASSGFSYYLQHMTDYNATYGSLGAVIGFMMWTWISVIILLVGAELNAEMEHQTEEDSTIGHPRPMGERGATVADNLGLSWRELGKKADPAKKKPAAAPPGDQQ